MRENEPWMLILQEEVWNQLLHEGAKSIAYHQDPKALIAKISEPGIVPHFGTSVRFTPDFYTLREGYRRDLSVALSTGGDLKSLFERYFKAAYAMGIRSHGIGSSRSIRAIVTEFTSSDHRYIDNMVDEELGFMRGFKKAMRTDTGRMNYNTRFNMYVEGLESIYKSGAVAALPSNSLIYWSGPTDKNKCESCWYLVRNSPYLPETLPTTPRACDTRCRTNCRDRLIVRPGSEHEVSHLWANAENDLRRHVENLNRIMGYRTIKPFPVRQPPQPPVELPQTEVPGLYPDEPSFYERPLVKAGKPKYTLQQRLQRYMGDRNENEPENFIMESSMDESILSAIKDFSGVSSARSTMKNLKDIGIKLDFLDVYMVVALQPASIEGRLIKAGPVEDMITWLEIAEDIYAVEGYGKLPWSFLGLSSFRDQVEDKSMKYGRSHLEKVTDVWIGNPRHKEQIINALFPKVPGEGPSDLDAYNARIAGREQAAKKEIIGSYAWAKKFAAQPSTVSKRLGKMGQSKLKAFITGGLSSLAGESARKSEIRQALVTEASRAAMGTLLGLAAAGAAAKFVTHAWGKIKALYRSAAHLGYMTVFPVITIKPLSVTDDMGHVHSVEPAVVVGPLEEIVEWLKVADGVHQKIHDGKALNWKIVGITTFRQDANEILSNPNAVMHGAISRWVEDPRDEDAIRTFILGRLAPEQLYPELRGKIVPRRVRKGEDEYQLAVNVSKSLKKQKHGATGKGGVYGYNPDLP